MNNGSAEKPSMYGLSTCGWCAKAKTWLEENVGSYDLVYVDLMTETEREPVIKELRDRVGTSMGFPIIFFGDEFVMGYNPTEFERLAKKKPA